MASTAAPNFQRTSGHLRICLRVGFAGRVSDHDPPENLPAGGAAFPHLTRFGVMKHIDVLRDAGLINTSEEGRPTAEFVECRADPADLRTRSQPVRRVLGG